MQSQAKTEIAKSVGAAAQNHDRLDVPAEAERIASKTRVAPFFVAHQMIEDGIEAGLDLETLLPAKKD